MHPHQLKAVFLAALDRSANERDRFIRQACCDDIRLESKVRGLLLAHQSLNRELDDPLFDIPVISLLHRVSHEVDFEFGHEIGKYRLVREIGRGGTALVYEAARIDGEYEQSVALKLIASGRSNEFINGRLRRERQILADLDHPNIARLLDGGTIDGGRPYLVMDLIRGVPIDEYVAARKCSLRERLELFCTVCTAVEYAHQNGVIHRDLKPSNILVTHDGVPKLLDFGIAKLLDLVPLAGDETIEIVGMTPDYSSPEQVRGESVTRSTDIYSLGVVLFKLLTRHLPYEFPARTMERIVGVISTQEPQSPSSVILSGRLDTPNPGDGGRDDSQHRRQLSSQLRGDLDNIVLMALRKDPERRYGSVRDFREDIQRHLQGQPVVARRDSWSYRTSKFLKRNRRLVSVGLIVAVLFSTITALITLKSVKGPVLTSIAVLPFVNSGDANMDHVSDGITDTLVGDFSRVKSLRTPGRSSVFSYKGRSVDPVMVAAELGVESVLTGFVDTEGNNLLVRVTLTDGHNGNLLLKKEYRGATSDIQTIEATAARDILDTMGLVNPERLAGVSEPRGTTNPVAYDWYLQGNYAWNQRTQDSLARALECYQHAIQADPDFALAYAGLANTYVLKGGFNFEKLPFPATAASEKAIARDPNLPEPYLDIAMVAWGEEWDWLKADTYFRRAVELNPNFARSHHWYGLFLAYMGRADESILELEKARQMDVLSIPIQADLGRAYQLARRYDEAYPLMRAAHDRMLGASMGDVDWYFASLLEQMRRTDELQELHPYGPDVMHALTKGYPAYWRAILLSLERERSLPTKQSPRADYLSALMFAKLGNNERAIEGLYRAYKAHDSRMPEIRIEPAFDTLRSDPRFKDLMQRMNFFD